MEYRPKIVLNCHEYPDIDAAEYEPETAYAINGFFTKNLSDLCSDQDLKLIQLSTSYVFNGLQSTPYREEDETDPVSVYGDSKLLGERFILESGCRQMIIRIPDLFGEHMPLFSRRLIMMNEDCSIQVKKGQVISPAYSVDLAKAISELISRDGEGMFHYGQEGAVMTGEMITRILELCARHGVTDKKYSVNEVEKEDFLAPGERPMYNVLDNGKISRAAGISVRGWYSALEDYISQSGSSIILS